MREIKFRGISKNNNRWVYGFVSIDKNSAKMEGFPHYISRASGYLPVEVVPKSVGQYTGLKDKNGVEIYEGDIDQAENGDKNVIVFLLKAGTYCVMPMDIYLNNDYQNEAFSQEFMYGFGYDLFFDNLTPGKYLNVIGNIYENPELLEEDQ